MEHIAAFDDDDIELLGPIYRAALADLLPPRRAFCAEAKCIDLSTDLASTDRSDTTTESESHLADCGSAGRPLAGGLPVPLFTKNRDRLSISVNIMKWGILHRGSSRFGNI